MTGRAPRLTWIGHDDPPESFPPVESAFAEPAGLLAAGGDLSTARLLYAYRHGIFPWYDDGQPILWWSPDPRCVLLPGDLHVARRLRRWLPKSTFRVTFDRAFADVITACAEKRPGQFGTWITPEMRAAYCRLHDEGWAHSVEIWRERHLVGGVYGLAIGNAFFGESMFSRVDNASKAALIALCAVLVEQEFDILDCQVESPHLLTLGAILMPRSAFSRLLVRSCVAHKQRDLAMPDERDIADFL